MYYFFSQKLSVWNSLKKIMNFCDFGDLYKLETLFWPLECLSNTRSDIILQTEQSWRCMLLEYPDAILLRWSLLGLKQILKLFYNFDAISDVSPSKLYCALVKYNRWLINKSTSIKILPKFFQSDLAFSNVIIIGCTFCTVNFQDKTNGS